MSIEIYLEAQAIFRVMTKKLTSLKKENRDLKNDVEILKKL